MKFINIGLLLFLTGANLSAQPADNPSTQTSVQTPAQLLQHSRRAQDQNHYAEAKTYAQKAIDAYTPLDQPDSLGEAIVMLWSSSSLSGMPYPDRIPLLEKAAAAFEKAGNRQRKADCLKEIADLQQLAGDLPAARLTLQNALQLYRSVDYPMLQGIYDLLCTVSVYLNDFDEGVKYGLLSIRYAERTQDTSRSLCAYYNHLGNAYYGLQDLTKAGNYYSRSLDIARKYDDSDGITTLAFNLVHVYTNAEKPRQALDFFTAIRARYRAFFVPYAVEINADMLAIYDRLDQRAKAAGCAAWLEKALKGNDIDRDPRVIAYDNLLYHYLITHEYDKANTLLSNFSDFVRQVNIPRYVRKNLFWHFRVDSARGELINAIRYYQQYKQLGDSIFSQTKSRQIEQYNALYESEKKDKNILLLQQQSQAQQTQLRQEKFLGKVTLGGVILLAIITGLLYYTVRTKQRSNRLLEAQREEIDRKNRSLQQLVIEKEWLVKEIHHRVKNNLHMVVGLLASQAEYLKGREAHEAIAESQHRVQAMSLIHQKLYNTENLSAIDMPQYVVELVDYLQSSFDTRRHIRFTLDIAKVSFPLSYSIPLGLILNEAITNAFKYAFPADRKGHIAISLYTTDDAGFNLIIRDDGIGIPDDYRLHSSLGIALIEGLAKDIRGNLGITRDNGTVITLHFPVANAAMPT